MSERKPVSLHHHQHWALSLFFILSLVEHTWSTRCVVISHCGFSGMVYNLLYISSTTLHYISFLSVPLLTEKLFPHPLPFLITPHGLKNGDKCPHVPMDCAVLRKPHLLPFLCFHCWPCSQQGTRERSSQPEVLEGQSVPWACVYSLSRSGYLTLCCLEREMKMWSL